MGTRSPLQKGQSPPQFLTHISCGQTAGWIKMALGTAMGLVPGHIVLDGVSAPFPRKGWSSPIFVPCPMWPNGCMYQDTTSYGGRLQPRRHCVRWEPSAAPPRLNKGAQLPLFSANVRCGQMAGGIKMPLGTEVNVGPGDVMLDGVAAPPKRGTAPVFRPMSLWPNGWMDKDATWYGSISRPRSHCVRREPVSPSRERGTAFPPLFGSCLLWPWLPISATAELSFIYFGKICRPDSDTTVLQVDADYIKKYNKTYMYVMYQYLQICYSAISTWTALRELHLDVWEPASIGCGSLELGCGSQKVG